MGLLSSLKSLFSSADTMPSAPETLPAVEYNGFVITPAPIQEQAGYRINGTISKGEQSHTFIHADTLPTAEGCGDEMVRKAKQMIDYQGDNIF